MYCVNLQVNQHS